MIKDIILILLTFVISCWGGSYIANKEDKKIRAKKIDNLLAKFPLKEDSEITSRTK